MTKLQVIAYLRQNCIVQDPSGTTAIDPVFLSLTNEELESVIIVALSKESPKNTVDNIPMDVLYTVILVAKKELYYQLASKSAPLYPLSLGDDGGVKKNVRFDHYMKLITEVNKEYDTFKSTGTPISVGNILLPSRYFSKRNYDLATPPSGVLIADLVKSTSVELIWTVRDINRFYSYLLYKSSEPIVDLYAKDPIKTSAVKVTEIFDIHKTTFRIEGLTPSTLYYVALVVQEANGLKGFSEISFITQL